MLACKIRLDVDCVVEILKLIKYYVFHNAPLTLSAYLLSSNLFHWDIHGNLSNNWNFNHAHGTVTHSTSHEYSMDITVTQRACYCTCAIN